jgi:hypothetical protein
MNMMNELTFSISQFGTRLGTRLEGAQARQALIAALKSIDEPGRLVISLDGVDVLSGSFADETIAIPCARLTTGEYGDRYLIVRCPNLEIAEDLSHKLERRAVAMLCLHDNGWEVLGHIASQMRQTLELVIKLQTTVAKELSEALGINHNTCLHRVGRLANLHLIRREEVGLAGPHAAYRFSSIITP